MKANKIHKPEETIKFSALWDRLHEKPQFRPLYPNESVVRFLMRNYRKINPQGIKVLDLGVGGGRHTKLLCELGFSAFGLDFSMIGLKHTRERIAKEHSDAGLVQATMDKLPFKEKSFDAVISYGVFNYGNQKDLLMAIQDLYRILKTNGKAFVMLRTTGDYRHGKGEQLEPNTFKLNIHDTNEHGTIQHFLDEKAVHEYFAAFSKLELEKTETTFLQMQAINSDWLITVEK
jgi:ubiquinone/menaquinone biosynthesis C-methylase UbiE